jgi:cytochrome c
MKKLVMITAALSFSMFTGAAFANDVFTAKCGMCHSTEAGVKKMGPSMFGIMGTKTALSGDAAWDAASMDAFLAAPDSVGMMQPVTDDGVRSQIITYLEVLK